MSARRRLAAGLVLAALLLGIGCGAAALAAGPCCCEAMIATSETAPASVTPCCDVDYTLDATPPVVAPPLAMALLATPPLLGATGLPRAALLAAALPRADQRALSTRVLRL